MAQGISWLLGLYFYSIVKIPGLELGCLCARSDLFSFISIHKPRRLCSRCQFLLAISIATKFLQVDHIIIFFPSLELVIFIILATFWIPCVFSVLIASHLPFLLIMFWLFFQPDIEAAFTGLVAESKMGCSGLSHCRSLINSRVFVLHRGLVFLYRSSLSWALITIPPLHLPRHLKASFGDIF